ncbi:unnamed protein product [Litomosoides sigmodontis]|uniref:Uncharacterized protein n=1 Tax=Litomosoides sigmodontis TaxID=42156 RepID=A0A3P6T1N2_LITSI|nr:unnamed protein product [Litomosoides sigmodontis]
MRPALIRYHSSSSTPIKEIPIRILYKTCDMCGRISLPRTMLFASRICSFDVTRPYDDMHPYLFDVSAI